MYLTAQLEPLSEQSTHLSHTNLLCVRHSNTNAHVQIERNTNSTTELKIETDTLLR